LTIFTFAVKELWVVHYKKIEISGDNSRLLLTKFSRKLLNSHFDFCCAKLCSLQKKIQLSSRLVITPVFFCFDQISLNFSTA